MAVIDDPQPQPDTGAAGQRCPQCSEFVDARWSITVDGRPSYLCWSGHRWQPQPTIDLRDHANPTRPETQRT